MKEWQEYLLGALLDGYIDLRRKEIQIYQKERKWLEFVNQLVKENFGITGSITHKKNVFCWRKKSKRLLELITSLSLSDVQDGRYFVAAVFDTEGSIYRSSKSRIPVIDITQSEKGLPILRKVQSVLKRRKIKSNINGPYRNPNSKLPQYHLRIYGRKNCIKFFDTFPIQHPSKKRKFIELVSADPIL